MAAPTTMCRTHFLCLRRILFRQIVTQSQLNKTTYSSTAAHVKAKSSAVRPPSESKDTRVELEAWVSEALANNSLKPKQHPGRLTLPTVTLPQRLLDAAGAILEKYPVKELSRKADKLASYLWSRHPPTTTEHVSKVTHDVYQQMLQKQGAEGRTDPIHSEEVLKTVRQKIYHWQPVT
ncbi:hypothetical protein ACOMHN_017479 [Nucella lapillus]